jgi:hypothetical protein
MNAQEMPESDIPWSNCGTIHASADSDITPESLMFTLILLK